MPRKKTRELVTNDFAEFIYRVRKSERLNQSQMADMIGMSQRQYSSYETEEHVPTLETAEKILNALGYTLKFVEME